MTTPIYIASSHKLRGLVTYHGLHQDPIGLGRDGAPVKATMALTSLDALFEDGVDFDAHIVTYAITDSDGNYLDRIPRLNKDSLSALTADGYEVSHATVWIDLDLKDVLQRHGKIAPPKLYWVECSVTEQQHVWKLIEDARQRLSDKGMEWAASCTTQAGLRFVHTLAMPVPAGPSYEALVGRFLTSYALAGLAVDESCKDWTRLFRAPRVTKEDGTETWNQEWYSQAIDLEDDACYYVPTEKDLRPPEIAPNVSIVTTAGRPTPDPIQAQALVEFYDEKTKRYRPTTPGKEAKRALKDSGVGPWIYERMPLAFPGKRHEMLTRAIGEVVGTLHGIPNIAPEFIYGLLYEPVGRLGEDEDWTGKLWEMTTSFWDKEELKKAQTAAIVAEAVAEHELAQESAMSRFLRGARTWCLALVGKSDEEAIEYLKESRLGVMQDARKDLFHVLMSNGYYDEHPCSSGTLPKVITQRNMEWLVPVDYAKDDGRGNMTVASLAPATIIAKSACVYSTEEIRLDQRGSYMKRDFEGREVFVHVPFYLRDDIEPLFTQSIYDSWLAAAGGDKDLCEEMLYAIGCLLLFQHGPTAAVLLWGEANAGKSLTGLSLAECLSTRRCADGASLTDNFNDSLRMSPIIHVDEALDRGSKGIDGSASLRRIITSSSTAIEQKGKDKVWMQGCHRVLMTANSEDILLSLVGDRVRDESDWRAIGERVASFELSYQAHEWFIKNNRDWVETKKWIGTHGRTGLYARFWFWVLKEIVTWKDGKPLMRGKRLLYEGNSQSKVIMGLQAETGSIPEVALAINRMLAQTSRKGAILHNGNVMVVQARVIEEVTCNNHKIFATDVRNVLKTLFKKSQPKERLSIEGAQAWWKAIDGMRLLKIIEQFEAPNAAFDKIIPAADFS